MHREIASFHCLTQDLPQRTHEEQVLMACRAGVKWIQLRIKKSGFNEWVKAAKVARKITSDCGVVLIINDNVEIAGEVNADGVHLGKKDLHWTEARKLLGDGKIIGLSTHSFEDVFDARNAAVDYLGIGPFRFTETKENLDPVLGLGAIRGIVEKMQKEKFSKPLIAIGGIDLRDVNDLIRTGIHGISVSSAINLSANPVATAKIFLTQIQEALASFSMDKSIDQTIPIQSLKQ